MFEKGLVALMKADATLMALIPGGIHPVKLPQQAGFPAITYARIGNEQPGQPFGDPPGPDNIDKGRIQISIWAKESSTGGYPAALTIDDRLRTILDGAAPVIAGGVQIRFLKFETGQDLYEDADHVFHRMTEFSFVALRS